MALFKFYKSTNSDLHKVHVVPNGSGGSWAMRSMPSYHTFFHRDSESMSLLTFYWSWWSNPGLKGWPMAMCVPTEVYSCPHDLRVMWEFSWLYHPQYLVSFSADLTRMDYYFWGIIEKETNQWPYNIKNLIEIHHYRYDS